ncbi:tyrosine-type recombinase/integrase [Staphylococcus chromogenes]|uniref:tyrosine-type recombinase/integrase n=1 Tax=Staphylococcus chromogenes TaxID=46126 RepID=UPI002887CBC2|nr:site-specific integrase [Staphylococcus chromogenes]MDT0700400.1 site-specific integrase [Staphylococcus chromogenes]
MASNVIKINELTGLTSTNTVINDFVNEVGINSLSTKKAYKQDLTQFCSIINGSVNVRIDIVVHSLTRKNIIEYRSDLVTKAKLKPNTINRKITAIKEFAKYLFNLGYDIDLNSLETIHKLKASKNSYEVLSYEEAMLIINWFKENEKEMPLEKYYYSLLAFDTGIRAEALNTLTPQSFIWKINEVLIKGIDKGNKAFTKSISVEFAKEIFESLGIDMNDNSNIFSFSSALRYKMMNRAKKDLGWSNRNITFHSFKKGAVNYAFESTKDIQIAREVGSHASVVTTQIYLDDNKKLFQGAISKGQSVGVRDINFSDYSKDQLIEGLSNLPEAMKILLKEELVKQNI